LKRAAKNYTIYEFYQNYSDIVRNVALGINPEAEIASDSKHANHRFFPENGMFINDVEVLGIDVQRDVEDLILEKQTDMIRQVLELADAQREAEIAEALSIAEQAKQELRTKELVNKMELQKKEAETKLEIQAEINRRQEAEDKAEKQAEIDMQAMLDVIAEAGRARDKAKHDDAMERLAAENRAAEEHQRALADIEAAKQRVYADTVKEMMEAITPDLIASLEVGGRCDLMAAMTEHISPYSLANGESVVDTTQKLLNGLPFDVREIVGKLNNRD
jgi:hypothetical protein